ncbi:MAG: putative transrane protein [Polaromonas sp.]|nr:putative transrane protein [Polaromonas sp.]
MILRAVACAISSQRDRSELAIQTLAGLASRLLPLGLAMAALLAWPSSGFAQPHKPLGAASATVTGKATASPGPAWSELTPLQQQALAPLAASWNTGMSEPQKRKWLEISKNYGVLTPEGQATLNSRMNDWVNLSPQQRAQARLNFGKTKELSKQLTPEEKKAKWEAYQALSPEEKQKLAAKASPRPTGAATAVKPVAPQKLAAVPAQAVSKPAPKITPSLPATAPLPGGQAATVGNGSAPQR